MQTRHRQSRRRVLKLASLSLLSCGHGRTLAQSAGRIERFDPALDAIVSVSEPIRLLATGLGNEQGTAEGPVWWKEGGYLVFSDIGNDRISKFTPGQGTSVLREPTNRANGLTRDLQGRLVACEQESRRVTRVEADGRVVVVADRYRGLRLNRPNDVVVKSDGAIYFTDPFNRPPAPPEKWEQPVAGVYRVSADLASVDLVAEGFTFPNGLAFSPDERVLYVADSRPRNILAYNVLIDGRLDKASERVFANVGGDGPGLPDGIKVDSAGNVYTGGAGGIWIIDPAGKRLGLIVHGEPFTPNIAFGGDDWKTLYFFTATTRRDGTSLRELRLNIPGLAVPARGHS